jgi:hypothetical protein
MSAQKKGKTSAVTVEPVDFLRLAPPPIPPLLDNVIHVFLNNIPKDALPYCALESGKLFPTGADEFTARHHLMDFVHERLERIARLEYVLWLNGRLPFITPRELLVWRLRQYVEHIWAFQLPDDDDLGMIFNTTRMRAAHLSADFVARFRKALLFPVALRRLYRILREEDENFPVVDREYEFKKAYGSNYKIPSSRYVQDANALIEEYRLRENSYLRDAELISKEDNIMWVNERVIELAHDDLIMQELLELYRIPGESGYEG